jgi:AcrR family transcriptional regulator
MLTLSTLSEKLEEMSGADTRAALIEAGLEIAEGDGLDALTLRSLGARAGVSRQAPYLYFADKQDLLAAMAAVVNRMERGWMRRAAARAKTPDERLRAFLRAHVRLFRERPRLYEVLYGGVVHKSVTPELQAEAVETFALVRGTVEECFPGVPVELARQRLIVVWGAVRGLADLDARRQVPPSVPGKLELWLDDALDALLAAWRARDAQGARKRKS